MANLIKVQRWEDSSNTAPASQIFVVNDHIISAFVEQGSRRPVVFIHGNSATKAAWLRQIAAVRERGHAVLALDLPGHGESYDSPRPEKTYNFKGYAHVVGDVLKQLQWQSFHVVGWSLGGHIGLELLATNKRLASLLIVGTPPIVLRPESATAAFHTTPSMALTGKHHFSDGEAIAFGTSFMGGERFLTLEILNAVRRTDGRAREIMVNSAKAGTGGADEREAVQTSPKPLCVVHGEDEPFIRLDYLQKLSYRALWRESIQVIPNTGHAPHCQSPATFNKILLEFLADVESELATQPHRKSRKGKTPPP